MTFAPISDETPITVSVGLQSQKWPWAKVAACFRDFPSGLDRLRADLERDGVGRHFELGFFHPQHPSA